MNKLLFCFLFFLMLTTPALAHLPSSIVTEYDKANNEIVLMVYHPIGTARHEKHRTHYIKEISLEAEGKVIDSETFNYQNHPRIVRTSFKMPKNSDKLNIKAICSTGNELNSEIIPSKLKLVK